mmetsp:Transcript_56718/g.98826  ORF Transcript_56718/g.98826 Transcript_56718/m.98826 type:complete len:109 (+) Transcript_56718:254-580(+)
MSMLTDVTDLCSYISTTSQSGYTCKLRQTRTSSVGCLSSSITGKLPSTSEALVIKAGSTELPRQVACGMSQSDYAHVLGCGSVCFFFVAESVDFLRKLTDSALQLACL